MIDDDGCDDESGWLCLLTSSSTRQDLERVILESTEAHVAEFRAALEERTDLSPGLRWAFLRKGSPMIAKMDRTALESAYARLRPN